MNKDTEGKGFMNINYDYKFQEKKDGGKVITVKDIVKSGLLEVKKQGNQLEIITRKNLEVLKFSLPLELFEKIYNDINQCDN
jgi:hypothetical protein